MTVILADDIFKGIFLNDRTLIQISPKFAPDGPIDNNLALFYNGLVPNMRQVIIWTIADPVHWHIYAALRGDRLIKIP